MVYAGDAIICFFSLPALYLVVRHDALVDHDWKRQRDEVFLPALPYCFLITRLPAQQRGNLLVAFRWPAESSEMCKLLAGPLGVFEAVDRLLSGRFSVWWKMSISWTPH